MTSSWGFHLIVKDLKSAALSSVLTSRTAVSEVAFEIVHKKCLVSKNFAATGHQAGHAFKNYCFQSHCEYILKVHPASITFEFAEAGDDVL